MNKEELTSKLLMEYTGHVQNALVKKTLKDLEAVLREQIAAEIEYSFNPPPIDEKDHLVWEVIQNCANIARGNK